MLDMISKSQIIRTIMTKFFLITSVLYIVCSVCVLFTDLSNMPYWTYFKPFLLAFLPIAALYYMVQYLNNNVSESQEAPLSTQMNILEEFIICAAIHLDDGQKYDDMPENIETGIVISGRRHGDCYTSLKVLNAEYWKDYDNGRENQGFLTSKNRYVSRNEAFLIAQKQGQIFHRMHDGKTSEMLVSEDLY